MPRRDAASDAMGAGRCHLVLSSTGLSLRQGWWTRPLLFQVGRAAAAPDARRPTSASQKGRQFCTLPSRFAIQRVVVCVCRLSFFTSSSSLHLARNDYIMAEHADFDLDSLFLALELQEAEVKSLSDGDKGRGKEHPPSDSHLAAQTYQTEMEMLRICLHDHSMARSVMDAINTDMRIIHDELCAEQIALEDRALARRVQADDGKRPASESNKRLRDESPAAAPSKMPKITHDDFESLATLSANFIGKDHAKQFVRGFYSLSGEPSVGDVANGEGFTPPKAKCEVCHDHFDFWDLARLPCRHRYCRECVNQLFIGASTDETLFPPRCCRQEVSVDVVALHLSPKTKAQFQKKAPEFRTPNRVYCHAPHCAAWIPPAANQPDQAKCESCGEMTCTTCKGAAHPGDCPHDQAMQEFLQQAEANQWQRCQKCRAMVELEHGCNHITCATHCNAGLTGWLKYLRLIRCRCGAQFCYVCGAPWKICAHPQWDEGRLLRRAEQVFERAEPPRGEGGNDERQIAVLMDELRENHECEHTAWRKVRYPGDCEVCGQFMELYRYGCRRCYLEACDRCRRNRL